MADKYIDDKIKENEIHEASEYDFVNSIRESIKTLTKQVNQFRGIYEQYEFDKKYYDTKIFYDPKTSTFFYERYDKKKIGFTSK